MSEYQQFVTDLSRGRGGKKKFTRDLYFSMMPDGKTLEFKLFDKVCARLTPDDNLELLLSVQDMEFMTHRARMEKLTNYTVSFFSDRSRHGNKKVPIRMADLRHKRDDTLPYTQGIKVNLRSKRVVNPEIAVDYVRVLDKAEALKVRRNMDALAKLARVSNKLDAIKLDDKLQSLMEDFLPSLNRMLEKTDFTDVSFSDVEDIMNIGKRHTTTPWRWYMQKPEPAQEKEYIRKIIDNGLKVIREAAYKKLELYSFTKMEKDKCTSE